MASDVPLISSYKKAFVYRRICQTLFAGIRGRRRPGKAALALSLVQVILFVLPAVMAVPFAVMIDRDDLPWWTWTGCYATLMFCYAATLQTTSRCCNSHSTTANSVTIDQEQEGMLIQ